MIVLDLPAYYKFCNESVHHDSGLNDSVEFVEQCHRHSFSSTLTSLSMHSIHFCHVFLAHFQPCLDVKAKRGRQMFYCYANFLGWSGFAVAFVYCDVDDADVGAALVTQLWKKYTTKCPENRYVRLHIKNESIYWRYMKLQQNKLEFSSLTLYCAL